MDRLQHLPVGAIAPLLLAAAAISLGLACLIGGRR